MTTAGAPAVANDAALAARSSPYSKLSIFVFIVLAFVWSWGAAFAASQAKVDYPALSAVLMILSGFGPTFSGLAVVALFGTRVGRREWFWRCLNWRVSWRWFALAFLAPPALMAFALALDVSMGAESPVFSAAQHIPLAIANFVFVFLIGGPLGEEFGWRGYLLPALKARLNWRVASLVIGVVWGLWHLPLFVLAGTAQSQIQMPLFLLNILAGSVLFGWLAERTRGSVLPALVLHTSLNAWAGIFEIVPTAATQRPFALVTGLLALVAAGLLLTPDRKNAQHPAG